ncbi:cation diffusion facilitator family transporter [Ideonella sp.]|uniref:cation diffusion facilitator family transporter n=1 Tax=Ideonella sp. TaxID=1929293 RepID=UPI002B4A8134|nr:cation diffusion facilitator family transporter [Ideonella sp.]HJV70082.1 cation diffusion facilitator family transporter [Ideonella sp.]
MSIPHHHDHHVHGSTHDVPNGGAHRAAHNHDHHGSRCGAGGHHHHVDPSTHGRAFVVAIALNSIFVAVEFGYGFAANSTALMADAGHNLSDVLGLILAWAAVVVGRRSPSERFTYGLRSSSILAALANAMLLLMACGAIGWEAAQRVSQPPAVASVTVMAVATIGILVNGLSAWMFVKGSARDLNIRGAYMHMAADAAMSLGVVLSGVVMLFTGWFWLDPLVSLTIVAVIVAGTWGLLRESLHLALNAVPPHIDLPAVAAYLRELPGVTDMHDLHIWGMSTSESALTVHLVMPDGYPGDRVIDGITQTLNQRFAVHHCTLQIERGTIRHACSLLAS